MENDIYTQLLKKYLDGECTSEEAKQVEQWYNNASNEFEQPQFNQNLFIQGQARMEQMWPSTESKQLKVTTLFRKYKTYGIAATILLCAAFALFKVYDTRNASSYGADIDPGKSKATITLADGTIINLTDAKRGLVSERSGIQITKNGEGEITFKYLSQNASEESQNNRINTIETPKGGEFKVCLPDGSNVWLNAASTLKFPSSFVHASERRIQLSGEAYFEIFKDKAHPFIVTSSKQQVQVLGTHFNINSYPDEPIVKTTLIEGSVMVTPDEQDTKPVYLKPDQQSVNNGSTLTVENVDAEGAISWHKGRFAFNEEPLENIMKKLSRWYGVTVIYKDRDVKYKLFGGTVSRYAKISEVLCLLELTGKVNFKIEGKEITVMN